MKTFIISDHYFANQFKQLLILIMKEPFEIVPSYRTNEESIYNSDCVIFTGGADVSPILRGEVNTASSCDIAQDSYNLFLFTSAYKLKKKIWATCGGHQFVHSILGGEVIQDIKPGHPAIHPIEIDKSYKFNMVNSTHHQGISKCGWEMIPLATYQDIIEMSMSLDGGILTHQFHPEFDSFPKESVGEYCGFLKEFLYGE
jgi:gamma-glutamyl-gamma-aminobutyrate hydrolase PuuD